MRREPQTGPVGVSHVHASPAEREDSDGPHLTDKRHPASKGRRSRGILGGGRERGQGHGREGGVEVDLVLLLVCIELKTCKVGAPPFRVTG